MTGRLPQGHQVLRARQQVRVAAARRAAHGARGAGPVLGQGPRHVQKGAGQRRLRPERRAEMGN